MRNNLHSLFTKGPRWVTDAGPSSIGEVAEFQNFRGLRLTLKLVGFKDASSPVLQVAMETSMRYDDDYVPLGRFLPVTTAGEVTTHYFDEVLLYVRWNVVQLAGATAACFVIEGEAIP